MEIWPKLETTNLHACKPETWALARSGHETRLIFVQAQDSNNRTSVIEFDLAPEGFTTPNFRVYDIQSHQGPVANFGSAMRIDLLDLGSYGALAQSAENVGKIAITNKGPELLVQDSRDFHSFLSFNLATCEVKSGIQGESGLIVSHWKLSAVENEGKVSWSREFGG